MQEPLLSYPLKVTSRSLPAARANRLRTSWFVLGMAFGVGCTAAFTSGMPNPWLTAEPAPTAAEPLTSPEPILATVDMQLAPVVTATLQPVDALPAAALPPVAAIEEPSKEVTLLAAEETPAPVVADAPAASEAAATYPLTMNVKVENGDTLINMLTDTGISYEEAESAVQAIRKVYDPKKLDIGQTIAVHLDKSQPSDAKPFMQAMELPISLTSSLELTRKDDAFAVKKIDMPVERKVARVSGEITSSLYETGVEKGLSPTLLSEIINAYSYDVDFQRDIKQGDSLDVMYERLETKDGQLTGYGNIIYAELELGDRPLKIYRYVDKQGSADYYNAKGESVRKALLRTPINGAKITSGFGMRSHPLLGYTKMHRGVDFGAATGTPIYAAGDGMVDFVGVKGGYGNYLRIKHNATYASAYAHISRFAKGISPGTKVKQGQIIAYVGSTGMSTGPHLHYEILARGEQVNPSSVKFKTGNVLQGKELAAFRKNISQIQAALATSPANSRNVTLADATPEQRVEN